MELPFFNMPAASGRRHSNSADLRQKEREIAEISPSFFIVCP